MGIDDIAPKAKFLAETTLDCSPSLDASFSTDSHSDFGSGSSNCCGEWTDLDHASVCSCQLTPPNAYLLGQLRKTNDRWKAILREMSETRIKRRERIERRSENMSQFLERFPVGDERVALELKRCQWN